MTWLRDALRTRRGPRTAFVLGGGGNLGCVQVGMLHALFERGVAPDMVIGCSVGALNAAAISAWPSTQGPEHLEKLWKGLRSADVFPGGHVLGAWAVARKGKSLCSNDGLRKIIEEWLPFRRFEEAAIPLHVVATSLSKGREVWFDHGDVVEPLLASTALPAIFPPVTIAGEDFIDGGVVDNVPISRALELGATRIVVLHVGNFERQRPEPRRPIDVLVQAFSVARSYRYRLEITATPEGVQVITLPAIDPGPIRYNDFSRSAQLIARARTVTAAFLDASEVTAAGL